MVRDLLSALLDLKEKEALEIVKNRLSAGDEPSSILDDARHAMEKVGKRFENGEYFIPDLVYSGEILRVINDMVRPQLAKAAKVKHLGKVVIGTVAGDIHDIGKDLVAFMLDISGFEVYDLGVDVPAEKFVAKIKETDAKILGLSGLLTLAFDSMKETVEAFSAADMREEIRIMIGGGQINEEIRKHTGADAYGTDAIAAVSLAKKWGGLKLIAR